MVRSAGRALRKKLWKYHPNSMRCSCRAWRSYRNIQSDQTIICKGQAEFASMFCVIIKILYPKQCQWSIYTDVSSFRWLCFGCTIYFAKMENCLDTSVRHSPFYVESPLKLSRIYVIGNCGILETMRKSL